MEGWFVFRGLVCATLVHLTLQYEWNMKLFNSGVTTQWWCQHFHTTLFWKCTLWKASLWAIFTLQPGLWPIHGRQKTPGHMLKQVLPGGAMCPFLHFSVKTFERVQCCSLFKSPHCSVQCHPMCCEKMHIVCIFPHQHVVNAAYRKICFVNVVAATGVNQVQKNTSHRS